MKTTPEMRARLRELCHPVAGRDDYDRAVLALLDDFSNLYNAAAIVYAAFKPISGPDEMAKALLKMELGLKD